MDTDNSALKARGEAGGEREDVVKGGRYQIVDMIFYSLLRNFLPKDTE